MSDMLWPTFHNIGVAWTVAVHSDSWPGLSWAALMIAQPLHVEVEKRDDLADPDRMAIVGTIGDTQQSVYVDACETVMNKKHGVFMLMAEVKINQLLDRLKGAVAV